ncbi:epoxide hydrolase [Epithele typhae]|uniref:epoxide hydrolase n=1 Tax=Epithele typhae TaxID=378194 RepID=UPI00200813C0|nr:epoxide hydrolase [Epithele typhae]KAH9925905.1 epoxide hydrolase [Epithele typhae]
MSEKPFKVAVSDADLADLRLKLKLARFPDELEGAGTAYGAPLADVKRIAAHWRDTFDWRACEAKMNELPMFTRDVEVDGFGALNMHYIHQRSEVEGAIPLLFCHGWPGNFLEVRKMLPLLTSASPDHPSFHVVAPSLPGFVFSEGAHKPGFNGWKYAEAIHKVMIGLGYNEYVYQGGDWGHIVGVYVVNKYGHKHVKAWHSNMPIYRPPSLLWNPLLCLELLTMPFNSTLRQTLDSFMDVRKRGTGYLAIQSTKPQTIGYSLTDSPVGLLGWIYEKLAVAVDDYPWTDDEVCEWVSLYWFSRAGPAGCSRIYYEVNGGLAQGDPFKGTKRTTVPLGASYFPRDPLRLPESWTSLLGKVVFESRQPKGGHFAAFEQPDALAGDLRKMFGKGGPAFGVVPGHSGYSAVSYGS